MTEHAHPHADDNVHYTQEFWDQRYASADRIWSGRPNSRLVATATALSPGEALDVGCGEGADAVWLAGQGWRVTAVDVSPVALGRAAEHAAQAGAEVAGRIDFRQVDLLSGWAPAADRYDLVSVQFLHLPAEPRAALHRRLGAAVRPGGTLLIVGHHPDDLNTSIRRPRRPDLMATAEQLAADFDPAGWVLDPSTVEREVTDPDGQPVRIKDSVLRAVRR